MSAILEFRRASAAAALLALSALAGSGAAAAATAGAARAESRDIAPDPALRAGVLPNGMHYLVLRNTTPPGQVAVRLHIAAGSLQETDAQQGLAHFLEHLAFRGSTHVPEGELQKSLERIGLRMGADTNAATGQSETTYRFDLPNNQDATIDLGLMLLRETAGELTLSQEAMDKERGVVLSEERFRDSPASRVREAQAGFILKGQFALQREPIGKPDVIRNAPVSLARDYYRTFYRPERATVIVAGDIDPDAVIAKITQHFAGWQASAPDGADPDLGMPPSRALESQIFVEEGAPRFVSVSWAVPFIPQRDTIAYRRHELVEAIATSVVNQRLQRVAMRPDAPFLSAGVGRSDMWRSATVASLTVNYDADSWAGALQEAEQVRRQAVTDGVAQAEVDREVDAMLTRFEAAAGRAATRPSPGLANVLLGTLEDDEVFSTPATDLQIAREQLRNVKARDVNAALREAFAGSGPLIFLSSPVPVEGGEGAVTDAWNNVHAGTLAKYEPSTATWPYTKFGTPGQVVEQSTAPDVGATFVRFANGVRLTVKPTSYRADDVQVAVNIAGGRLVLPRDKLGPAWAAGTLISGGLRGLDSLEIRRLLGSKIYGTGFQIADDSFVLSGRTRAADLDTQLQVLTAFLTAPGWRPEAFQRLQNSYVLQLDRAESTPAGALNAQFAGMVHSGDMRWVQPRAEDVRATAPEDLKKLVESWLAWGPLEVVIVGDITVERAIATTAATFGALPPRLADTWPKPQAGELRFPAANAQPLVLPHKGRADQGIALIAWPTTDTISDVQGAADRQVMSTILRMRMTEVLRENSGVTYSPQAIGASSLTFPGYGYTGILAETPPDKAQFFVDTARRIAADLRREAPPADELERARKPARDALARTMQTNGYWLDQLSGAQTDETRLAAVRYAPYALGYVTADRVRYAAATWLRDDTAWTLLVEPKAIAEAQESAPVAHP
jgi:zinc protease